jgi:acyl carrier protein
MGLDAVEIVMAVEEAFDIRIENGEAEKILMPRQLIELVMGKVVVSTTSVCLTHRAFNLLRKSLLLHGDWKRTQIIPDTNLNELIPRDHRKPLVSEVTRELGISKPFELIRPAWMIMLLLTGPAIAGLIAGSFAISRGFGTSSIWLFFGAAILTAGFAIRATQPCCTEFPRGLKTVGDFSRWVMTHKADLSTAAIPAWTRDQVAARVREIIIGVLGCKPDFSEDANFVKDLGLG